MIAFAAKPKEDRSRWQETFLPMLPEIESRLRYEFRAFGASSREEAIHEGVAHCVFAYIRLHERGRTQYVTPWSLVFYSSRDVRRGRPAAGQMNCNDPLSRYAQLSKHIRVDSAANDWIDTLAEDKRASVIDQVAAKMDVGDWFASLSRRMKQIAKDLALGFSTSEVAQKHAVSAGRISQLRRSLERSWREFQGEEALTVS